MKRYFFLILITLLHPSGLFAGTGISGTVKDTAGTALRGATVSLLDPSDSTLVKFSITGNEGQFAITDIREGAFLLQIAIMGYYTEYRTVRFPLQDAQSFSTIVLKENPAAHVLNEVIISGEKVPVKVLGDTLEYNAGSFKVKPDAPVEDLLRKLPGMQVDENGNIKAMGKDVNKVLVDGKEFFGNDPKVATKNLPADAIDKVQTFEKQSDESLFSGIDDGVRDQTINLVLKAGKKAGYFGEAMGGVGTPSHYDASVKAFKFRTKSQIAALGMANNINKFGFTFDDYVNFNGGIGSLLRNGRLEMNADEIPVDFGQPVTGSMSTQALGFNYGLSAKPANRFNISYMGYGLQKLLQQTTNSTNYTPGGDFKKQDISGADNKHYNNGLSGSWYSQLDTGILLTGNIHAQLTNKDAGDTLYSRSYLADATQNELFSHSNSRGHIFKMNGSLSLVKKMKGNWPVLQLEANGSYERTRNDNRWMNETRYISGQQYTDRQFQNNSNTSGNMNLQLSAVRRLGGDYFLKPFAGIEYNDEISRRDQGLITEDAANIDSLSPGIGNRLTIAKGGIELKKNNKMTQASIGLTAENIRSASALNGADTTLRSYRYLLPYAFWQREVTNGGRIGMRYATQINMPRTNQLLPATDYSNPLFLRSGNALLKPEYQHSLNLNYTRFDQFTMSTFFVSLDGRYTKDKIGWSQAINSDLTQRLTMANVRYEWSAGFSANYARPVPRLELTLNAGIRERFSKATSPVNEAENINTTFNHTLELSVSNRNNDVVDARLGGEFNVSTSKYSINARLNNVYTNYTGFAKLGYRPSKNWSISTSMDFMHYNAQGFSQSINIPLMKAEITRYLFANQRGALTLKGFDLLDKNRSVLRTSQLNYFIEQQSNIISRYFLLSFSYRLNKVGQNNGITVNGR